MSDKKRNQGQVTGFMTIKDSNRLPFATKQAVVAAPEGHVRKFRKILLDPESGEKVVLEGKVYIGGLDKEGKVLSDRKQSLTCRVAFKVENVESFLAQGKITEEEMKQEVQDTMLASLLGGE